MSSNPIEPTTPSYKDFVYHLSVYLGISVYRANICAGNLVPPTRLYSHICPNVDAYHDKLPLVGAAERLCMPVPAAAIHPANIGTQTMVRDIFRLRRRLNRSPSSVRQ